MSHLDERTLTHLLDAMENAATAQTVSVKDVLTELGERSITPFILLFSIMLVSPLSGIPTVPTFAALILVTLSVQALLGRHHIWLPGFVLRREVEGKKVTRAVAFMRRPCAFLDRHAHRRLTFLTKGPMRFFNLLICLIIPITWPALELLPMVTTIGASVVALVSFGVFTRDGLYVFLGYAMISVLVSITIWLWP